MSNQIFSFADDSEINLTANTRKHRRKKSLPHITSTNKQHFDVSFENAQFEEGTTTGSLTYSTSSRSSQAGESTDSSISEIEYQPETSQTHQQNTQQQRGIQMHRKVSNASDSLNYSEDDEVSLYRREIRDMTGQSSNSYGHDGGGSGLINPKYTSPPTATAFQKASSSRSIRRGSSSGRKQSFSKRQFSPPMVPSDVSLSSQGTNTPSSPPPRYSRRMSPDHSTEVWYAKWWMCGFTDALNINANY